MIEPVDKVVIQDGDDVGIGLENVEWRTWSGEHGVEKVHSHVGSRDICDYVVLPRVVE